MKKRRGSPHRSLVYFCLHPAVSNYAPPRPPFFTRKVDVASSCPPPACSPHLFERVGFWRSASLVCNARSRHSIPRDPAPRARARPRRSHKALPEKESEMPQLASQPPHASTSFLSRLRYIGTRPRDSFFSRVGQALLLRLPWGRSAEKYRARGAGCFCLYERKYIDGGEREYDLPRYGDDGGAALSFKNSWTLRSKRMRESVRSRGCDDVLIFNFILLSYKRKF